MPKPKDRTTHSPGTHAAPETGVLGRRKKQYLIAPAARTGAGVGLFGTALQPFSMSVLEESLKQSGDIEIIDRISPPGVLSALGDGQPGTQPVLVASMPEAKASVLKANAGAQIHIEENLPLSYQDPGVPQLSLMDQIPVAVPGPGFSSTFTVLGGGKPVEGAQVCLFGSVWPAQGTTDANGRATLTLYGESPQTVRALYVKSEADFWSFYITQPQVDPNSDNTVMLTPLTDSFAGFPNQEVMGWGQRAMGLDQVPSNYRGAGVKIAIIDSGAATSHEDLAQVVRSGYDVINKSPEGWDSDTVFHGTHCAGVIAGSINGHGIRGFAPDAQVIACKIFPGGAFSSLISALDFCMEQGVDVINLSLGAPDKSEIVEQRLAKARQLGIACIVAAGNSGGPVQYPASSPNVLAVAAVGKQGVFPPDSYHTQTVADGSTGQYFPAKFSCAGPEIGVCAPGVAILSSVPPNDFAAWDGTSMAAPHVTGLAALVLAHHDDFRGAYKDRNAARVDRLFDILRQSADPLGISDRNRVGAGMPNASRALNLQPAAPSQDASADLLRRLVAAISSVGPAASGAIPQTTISQLRDRMQEIGLIPGAAAAPPQPAPQPGPAPQSTGPVMPGTAPEDPHAALDRLKASMQELKLI